MWSRRTFGAAAGALIALLGACTSSTEQSEVDQSQLLLVKPAAATLQGGQSLKLAILIQRGTRITQAPAGVVWSSSNAEVATVAGEGLVQGGREGSADIVAYWNGLRGVARMTVVVGTTHKTPCPVLSVGGTGPRGEKAAVCQPSTASQ